MADSGLDGEPLSAPRDCLMVLPDGQVDTDCCIGLFSFGVEESASSCSVLAITEVGDKVLVAVPHSVWGRKVKSRLIPRSALTKACCVEVASVNFDERDSPTGVSLKVWLGLLDTGLEGALDFDSEEPAALGFGEDCPGVPLMPHAPSLAAAAQDTFAFAFHSADSAAPAGESPLPTRSGALEATLTDIAAGMKVLLSQPLPLRARPRSRSPPILCPCHRPRPHRRIRPRPFRGSIRMWFKPRWWPG